MNRIIKFRAWDGEKMREVRSLHNIHSQVNIHAELCALDEERPPAVLNDKYDLILMQFTGLLDKNGKEIYEGDIVKSYYIPSRAELLGVVEWQYESFGLTSIKDKDFNDFHYYVGHEYEVIGNIYENPELLKEEKNKE